MTFTRSSAYSQLSEDGRYSVAATKHGEHYRFLAWRITGPGPTDCVLLGTYPSAAEARAKCEQDV